MSIPIELASQTIARMSAGRAANLQAQSRAYSILKQVGESDEKFPDLDQNLEEKTTHIAFALLAAACSLAEQERRAESIEPLERAATLLSNVNLPNAEDSKAAAFNCLIAAMAYYAAGQYSRAFVMLGKLDQAADVSRILASFLRRDINGLLLQLNNVLLAETPEFLEQWHLDEWAMTVAVARVIAATVDFIFSGHSSLVRDLLERDLEAALAISESGAYAGWWWLVRLLKLMLSDLQDASPWSVLPPHFDPASSSRLGRYIKLLAFGRKPVFELWISQRAALKRALDEGSKGAVINLRTSAGKTRVAETAILKTLIEQPGSRVLYIAPFRSLAFEIEETLNSTLDWMGYTVTHLYGGSRFGSADAVMASEARVIVATPEKTRAMLRAAPELLDTVRLIIVDEGHLLGPSDRFVRNEFFLEHLRGLARRTSARLLLLSAVLPNAQQMAQWIAGDPDSAAVSDWKPAGEHFGWLRWNGSRVMLEWLGDVPSFNPAFVVAEPTSKRKGAKRFPGDKNEAVAAAAVKLSSVGPVMIFTARAVSVPPMARSVLTAMGDAEEHPWPDAQWKVFESACMEELGPYSPVLQAARAGIVCHSNALTPQVRQAMERLMRSTPPRVIIATTTLAQGVNVGISTVIVASTSIDQHQDVDVRDFWNICGRAGRAFSDSEGKVLYALDDTLAGWQVKKARKKAKRYLKGLKSSRVESGILAVVSWLRRMAEASGISFELLLTLVAENDFSRLGDQGDSFGRVCDLLDDALLAMHVDPLLNAQGKEPSDWIDDVLRDSLASIQAATGEYAVSSEELMEFLTVRAENVLARVPNANDRRSIAATALPFSTAIFMKADKSLFLEVAERLILDDHSLRSIGWAVGVVENWALEKASAVIDAMPSKSDLDQMREGWLEGVALDELSRRTASAAKLAKDFYGYQLPWILHAASQNLRRSGSENSADALASLSLLTELGVPTTRAALVYLAGLRSRVAATELSEIAPEVGSSIDEIRQSFRDPAFLRGLNGRVSQRTQQWIELLLEETEDPIGSLPRCHDFTLAEGVLADELHARTLGDSVLLCTLDGREKFYVESSQALPFAALADRTDVCFVKRHDAWQLKVRNPRVAHD